VLQTPHLGSETTVSTIEAEYTLALTFNNSKLAAVEESIYTLRIAQNAGCGVALDIFITSERIC
jgi:hypothetical protein